MLIISPFGRNEAKEVKKQDMRLRETIEAKGSKMILIPPFGTNETKEQRNAIHSSLWEE